MDLFVGYRVVNPNEKPVRSKMLELGMAGVAAFVTTKLNPDREWLKHAEAMDDDMQEAGACAQADQIRIFSQLVEEVKVPSDEYDV